MKKDRYIGKEGTFLFFHWSKQQHYVYGFICFFFPQIITVEILC